jgi:hypothetical protein
MTVAGRSDPWKKSGNPEPGGQSHLEAAFVETVLC